MKNIRHSFILAMAAVKEGGAGATWLSALWTFPSVLVSAMLIAWGAEAAQFIFSQGLALAILAWLQTLPEFAVEAAIALEASRDPQKIHLVTANFTGSLRLLTGLGWPMIYAVASIFNRRKNKRPLGGITLEKEHCVEVVGLIVSILYFVVIYIKGTLTSKNSCQIGRRDRRTRIHPKENFEFLQTGKEHNHFFFIPCWRDHSLFCCASVPGKHVGCCHDDGRKPVRFCPVGFALPIGIPGKSECLSLGATGKEISHGFDEHGFFQYQSMDHARCHDSVGL
jgi:hypothetical protein